MITRQSVSEQLLAYLNNELTLTDLVVWAENCFVVGGFSPDDDIPVLRDVVSYLAGADSSAFPLTWDVSMEFLKQLGTSVRIVPT